MMKNKTVYPDTMPCPCGSNKKYKDCCKKKKVEYFLDGNILTKSIPIHNEVHKMLEVEIERFKQLYGRDLKDEEFVCTFSPIYNDDNMMHMIYAFRNAGIPENKIYAYYKTDGLIPCELNEDIMPEKDIEEFKFYCEEYDRLISEETENSMNSLQYTLSCNDMLESNFDDISQTIVMVLNDFIRRHSKTLEITNYKMTDEIDYYLFSGVKTIKTLTSIKKLKDEHMTECIYALSRGIFENYMYLCKINKDEKFFSEKLLPKVDDSYTFATYPDGRTNYKKVIKTTDKDFSFKYIGIKLYDILKDTEIDLDKEIYNIFYETACQYVHVDVLSAKNYFSCVDPYDEIDPSIIAYMIAITLSVMLLGQMAKYRGTQEQYKKDISHLFESNFKDVLTSCLMIANQDPEYKNDILDLFRERIELENIN